MKNFFIICAALLSMSVFVDIKAQCDLIYEDGNYNSHWNTSKWGQSLTIDPSCGDGSFTSFEFKRTDYDYFADVRMAALSGLTILIYEGIVPSGPPLYTQTFDLPEITVDEEWQGVQFGSGTGTLDYTAGEAYSFVIVNPGPNTTNPRFKYRDNAFSTGTSLYSYNSDLNHHSYTAYVHDMEYRINSGEVTGTGGGDDTAAVPTMGEWAPIMMSVGVVTVRRRELSVDLQTA